MSRTSNDEIVSHLRGDGYFLLPGFAHDLSAQLEREHQCIFEQARAGVSKAEAADGERICSSTIATLSDLGLDNLARVLGVKWFVEVARQYFQAMPDDIGEGEIVSFAWDGSEQDPDKPGNHWMHWDPFLSLRLMLYVSDVTRENGAIEIKPGTHHDNHRQRLLERRACIEYADRPVCAGRDIPFVPIEAPAGTLIVFDTSLTHRRGRVAAGRERRVAFNYLEAPLGTMHREGRRYESTPTALLERHF